MNKTPRNYSVGGGESGASRGLDVDLPIGDFLHLIPDLMHSVYKYDEMPNQRSVFYSDLLVPEGEYLKEYENRFGIGYTSMCVSIDYEEDTMLQVSTLLRQGGAEAAQIVIFFDGNGNVESAEFVCFLQNVDGTAKPPARANSTDTNEIVGFFQMLTVGHKDGRIHNDEIVKHVDEYLMQRHPRVEQDVFTANDVIMDATMLSETELLTGLHTSEYRISRIRKYNDPVVTSSMNMMVAINTNQPIESPSQTLHEVEQELIFGATINNGQYTIYKSTVATMVAVDGDYGRGSNEVKWGINSENRMVALVRGEDFMDKILAGVDRITSDD